MASSPSTSVAVGSSRGKPTDRRRPPFFIWLILLAVVFAAEYCVMLILPWLLPTQTPRIVESVVDSVLLTMLIAPVLWWTLIRPLREVIRLRAQFLTDLFAQIETDRRRTAYDLHDGVGQSLTMLLSGLRSASDCRAERQCAARVERLQHLAEDALQEVRRVTQGLRPTLLDDLGLVPALERLVDDIRSQFSIEVALETDEFVATSLAEPVTTAVFRIVQEALTNAVKHSQASRIAVSVCRTERGIVVSVSDDGCGIPPERLRVVPPGQLGLRGMHERTSLLGGELLLESSPGRGTQITVTFPYLEARR